MTTRATTMHRCARWLLVAATIVGPSAGAQLASNPVAGGGVQWTTYSFGDAEQAGIDRMSLLTVPVTARALVANRVELGVSTAYASGTLTRSDGSSTTVSGLGDTEVRLTHAFLGDRVRVSAVALLPTGKSELTAAEMEVVGVVAADLLPFPISSWGAGGGIGLNAATAMPVDEQTSVGLSSGFVVARSYDPLEATEFAYRPGTQFHLRAAADRRIGQAAKASLQLTYLHFGQDRAAGSNYYQSGDRLQGVGSYAFTMGARGTAIAYAGFLHRQEGRYTSVVGLTPSQDLLFAGVGARHPLGRAILVPSLDVRILGNGDGLEQGHTYSVGSGVEIPWRGVDLVPNARVRVGRLTVRAAQESGFTGFDLGFTVRNRTVSR